DLDLTTLTLRPRKPEDLKTYPRGIQHESGPLTLKVKWPNLEITGGPGPVTCKAYGPVGWDYTFAAGGRVVSHPCASNSLHVFDAATGKPRWTVVSRSHVQSVSVSPDPDHRYVVAGSADETLTVFNPATGKVLLTVFPAGRDWVAWTPEGYYAATPGGEK